MDSNNRSPFYVMTKKADNIIKKVKRDVPVKGAPENRLVFIKAIQARLTDLEHETMRQILRK